MTCMNVLKDAVLAQSVKLFVSLCRMKWDFNYFDIK
jgi:hypothetical protein